MIQPDWIAIKRWALLLLAVGVAKFAWADLSQPDAISRELQQQEQRDRALREERRAEAPDARLLPLPGGVPDGYPRETPCYAIVRVELRGGETRPQRLLQPLAERAVGWCLGVEGINLLMSRMQNRLVEDGLVTTRVLAPAQDLRRGLLVLHIVNGRVGRLLEEGRGASAIDLASTLPVVSGDLLDLRDLEQGLENLQRLPGVRAGVQLVPGQRPGESDLKVSWQQQKKWRVSVMLDDAGSEQTGKKQAAATLFLDNPLGKGDLFYLSRGRDLLNPGARGNDSYQLHYSIPYGYWMFGLNASRYGYYQTISGGVVDYRYRGEGHSIELDIDRVVYRSGGSRTTLGFRLGQRASSNFIDDIEIALQRRRTAYWELAIRHRAFFGRTTLELGLSYRTGLKGLGAEPAAEESSGKASARAAFWQAGLDILLPFEIGQRRLRYHGRLRAQVAQGALTPPDRFAIGSRWTVRGYDGEFMLVADNGWYLRNELAWQVPRHQVSLFAGLDLGRVTGHGSELLPGQSLAGTVVGLRGNRYQLDYELFAGVPLTKPSRFDSDNSIFGFSLNWQW